MTPEQFLNQVQKQRPAPAYLFYGPEAYNRQRCRRTLIASALPLEDRESGFTHLDLDETSLEAVIDDARSFSLFAVNRLLWVSSAEGALPRGRAAAAAEDDEVAPKGSASAIQSYLKDPPPDTVLVFDCSRYTFDNEDKAKLDRLLKFYGSIPSQVEFKPFTTDAARTLAQNLARQLDLRIAPAEIGLLVESLGADASRLAVEIEKLSLYAGKQHQVTEDDLNRLIPNAQVTTIFALVSAMGRNDRIRSLDLLETLVRDGEYLPLALTFLATQFRMALVAREAGLKSAAQIQAHFTGLGVRIWRDRADQVYQTVSAFSKKKLEVALQKVFSADRGLRDARPDDRIVMEELILALTK